MSRGPGRIERAIRALFDANPDHAFVTDELCEHCYPGVTIEKKHQVAVLRAVENVLKDDPDWTAASLFDQGSRSKFYNRDSAASRTSPVRGPKHPPIGKVWVRCGHGYRKRISEEEHMKLLFGKRYLQYVQDRERSRQKRQEEERVRAHDDVEWHRIIRDADESTRQCLLDIEHSIGATGPEFWSMWMKERRACGFRPDEWIIKCFQAPAVTEPETLNQTIDPKALAVALRVVLTLNDPDQQRAEIIAIAAQLEAA